MSIITVWVDDLLLFASSEQLMQWMKDYIHSQWEATDMGDPAKIIGIKITQIDNCITISQEKYIEAILQREHMEDANLVATPLDANNKLQPNPDGAEVIISQSSSVSFSSLRTQLNPILHMQSIDLLHIQLTRASSIWEP